MKYKGRLIEHELTDVYDKILKPALRKVDELTNNTMGQFTKGLNLPPGFM